MDSNATIKSLTMILKCLFFDDSDRSRLFRRGLTTIRSSCFVHATLLAFSSSNQTAIITDSPQLCQMYFSLFFVFCC